VSGSIWNGFKFAEEVAGGAVDEGHFSAPGFGEVPRVGEGVAGGGGVAIEDVDLADVGGDGLEGLGVGDALGGESFSAFVDAGGDAAEEGGMVVGGGAEDVAVLVEAEAPGVVVELVEEFDIGEVF
jgi:hypothetical protein